MPPRRLFLLPVLGAALLLPGGASPQTPPAVTATTFVISGRGWGHGVGMSQWGAYGYAKHGVTYDKILAHYYPGTTLGPSPLGKINVLLVEGAGRVVVSSPDPSRSRAATASFASSRPATIALDSKLSIAVRPRPAGRAAPRPARLLAGQEPALAEEPVSRARSLFDRMARSCSVINSVSLESYVRGVVSSEMPSQWPVEAVKAQAVAARSYALAHRRGGGFDVYNDTRDQVYGGISAETPTGDQAVLGTKRQVLLYDGKVAQTFFFSSSGGRTAAVTDVFASAKSIPYLVAVSDPYDTFSPYHTLGPRPDAGGNREQAARRSRRSPA